MATTLGEDFVWALLAMREIASPFPYTMDDSMIRVLMNAGGKPFPRLKEMEEWAKKNLLGSFGLFLEGTRKADESADKINPPPEIILYLTSVFCSLSIREEEKAGGPDKDARDKFVIHACHVIAKRWPKLGNLCSGLSCSIIRGNENVRKALNEYGHRAGERLMLSGASIGAIWRLSLKFGEDIKPPAEQVRYLLCESEGDTDERRELLAIARACDLLKDREFSESGGFAEILAVFEDNHSARDKFLQVHLDQTIEEMGLSPV